MSEHKTNPQAILHATLPSLLPNGYQGGVSLSLEVTKSENVLLLPPEQIRTNAEGKLEALIAIRSPPAPGADIAKSPASDSEPTWQVPPEGLRVFEAGKELPADACDLVIVLGTSVRDGQHQSQLNHRAIARMPLAQWQEAHLSALRQHTIVAPPGRALGLVK